MFMVVDEVAFSDIYINVYVIESTFAAKFSTTLYVISRFSMKRERKRARQREGERESYRLIINLFHSSMYVRHFPKIDYIN